MKLIKIKLSKESQNELIRLKKKLGHISKDTEEKEGTQELYALFG